MHKLEVSAQWWNPNSSDTTPVGGILRFDPSTGAKLELIGALDNSVSIEDFINTSDIPNIETIFGITTDGKKVTLIDNTISNSRIGSSGYPTQSYKPTFVLLGEHFNGSSAAKSNSIILQYDYLKEWFGKSGFSWQRPFKPLNKGDSVVLTYTQPEDIIAQIDNGTITIYSSIITRLERFSPSITQNVTMEIELTSELTLSEWMRQFLTPLQHLASLATGRPNSVTRFDMTTLSSDSEGSAAKRKLTNVFYEPVFHAERNDGELNPHEILFSLQQGVAHENTIRKWLQAYSKYSQAINLFFGAVYYPARYMDSRFMHTIQTVEVVYAFLFNKHNADAKQGYTRAALKTLLDASADVMLPLVKNKSRFISLVIAERNYYSHYNPNLEDRLSTRGDVFWLNEALKIMLQRIFLSEIGFTSEECVEIFNNNQKYLSIRSLASFEEE